jgi:hypothetical protein
MLTLYEELLLLAIHEDKGTLMASYKDNLRVGLVGAILAELALMGKISLKDEQRIGVLDSSPTGDDILNQVLEGIGAENKERKIVYFLGGLIKKTKKLAKRLTENLVQKGVVSQEEDRLLWVMSDSAPSDLNASAKYLMKNRLRALVLTSAQAEPRDIALLNLIRACGLLDLVFVRDERKLANRRIYEMVVGEALKHPAAQTIEAIGVAIESVVEED